MKTKQTPIRFPLELLDEIDTFIGPRERSKFIIEATRKELKKIKQQKAIQKAKNILKEEDYPKFASSEDVADWVRELRDKSDAARRELFHEE